MRVEFFGDEIDRITRVDPLTGEVIDTLSEVAIFPARHFVTPADKLEAAITKIQDELAERLEVLTKQEKLIEAQRLRERTMFDIEMLRETGVCLGVENYSRHLSGRDAGETPWTLMDYLPDDFIFFIDESHVAVPQARGMYFGDRARKETLVEYGFRLPSALDNRPLTFDELERHMRQVVFVSATPGPFEREHSEQVVEQLIRPTGLLDPVVEVRPVDGQIDDLLGEVRQRVAAGQRCLVTTLTKRNAEQLAEYMAEMGVKVHYLHSEIETLERIEILRDLRIGVYDVVVGINLLRGGLDLPEVSLVAILDADKEGYLRSETSLIQTIGRAARHADYQQVKISLQQKFLKEVGQRDLLTASDREIAAAVAEFTERVLANEDLLLNAEERSRLGRQVHDGVLQALTGIRLELQALAERTATVAFPGAAVRCVPGEGVVLWTVPLVIFLGVLLAVVAASITLRRYLRV